MRLLSKAFPLVALGFLFVPSVRAQFENGCCNQLFETFTTCTNGICQQHFVQYACREYSGPGEPGIKAVAGGVVCCNKIYQQLFSDGSCTGDTAAASSVIEQHQKLEYVRNCSGTYDLASVFVRILGVESVSRRRASHENATASK